MRATTEALYMPPFIKPGFDYTLNTHSIMDKHYTYDMPDDVGVADFACPYCGDTDPLEAIEL